jgi:hypothetical protein
MRKVIDPNDAYIVEDIFKFKPWLSNSMEEIADNTTCWDMCCMETQQWFVVAQNTIFCCNYLHKTHNHQ